MDENIERNWGVEGELISVTFENKVGNDLEMTNKKKKTDE